MRQCFLTISLILLMMGIPFVYANEREALENNKGGSTRKLPGGQTGLNASPRTELAPVTVSVNPPNGATADLTYFHLVVTFSEQMDLVSVVGNESIEPAITLTAIVPGWVPTPVPVDIGSIDGTHFFLTPKAGAFQPNVGYVVKIAPTAVSKQTKKPLSGEYTSNFFLNEYPCDDQHDPTFTLNVTGSCTHHPADECDNGDYGSVMEGTCDSGFLEGELVVVADDSKFVAEWSTKNVAFVESDCIRPFKFNGEEVDFSNGSTGQKKFHWNGPFPWQAYGILTGFSPLPGYAPPGSVYSLTGAGNKSFRKGGTFHCVATAYGACGKKVVIPYSYACP